MADYLKKEDGFYLLQENGSKILLTIPSVVTVSVPSSISPFSTTPIPSYQIIVKDLSGNVIGEIDHYKNLQFQKVLNAEGDFHFDMSIMDSKANSTYISHRAREV